MSVLRDLLGAIVGYIVIVLVVMLGIGIAWMALGAEGAFAGEGPTPSTPWMVLNLLSGFIAAFVGGLVARKAGRTSTAVWILAGLIVVLGLVTIFLAGPGGEPPTLDKPVAELTFREAGEFARQPDWYNWIIPLVGVAGALLGGRDRRG